MSLYQDYVGSTPGTPGGAYRIGFTTGAVTGLSAGDKIFCWRWGIAGLFCRMRQIKVAANMNTAFGTAQVSDIALFKARNWTTAPTAGATITLPTQLDNQMVQSQGSALNQMASILSLFTTATIAGMAAIANTGALTTGSPTLDVNPLAYDVFNVIALGSSDRVTLYEEVYGLDYPLTFGQNEGFVLSVPTAQGASGKLQYYVSLVFQVTNTPF